ncbi:MAG: HU family DNA-binding protein [Fusobacteriaceae bacterium]
MTKKELSSIIREEFRLTTAVSENIVNAVIENIRISLAEGETVELFGLGKFETVQRAERIGRNPKTGEEIKIEAKKAVKFKAAKALSIAINL